MGEVISEAITFLAERKRLFYYYIWDVDRAYGVYAFVGETASFVRWMRFELEAGIGFQGRYR